MSPFLKKVIGAAQEGGLVLSANKRLYRHLRSAYDRQMSAEGRKAWPTPQIFSFEGWLSRVSAQLGEDWKLLPAAAQKRLWEQIIEADNSGAMKELLQVAATAEMAQRAEQLLGEHSVSLDGLPLSADQRAFKRWRQTYRRHCEDHSWYDRGDQLRLILQALRDGVLSTPGQLLLVGFDQLTPFQRNLLAWVREQGGSAMELHPEMPHEAQALRFACDDSQHEVEQAARWARTLLERGESSVGVVVADLQERRALIERSFLAQLEPESCLIENHSESSFSLSLGAPLIEQGPIAAALELLSVSHRLSLDQCCTLLRSPYLLDAKRDADRRARFEARLRSFRQQSFTRERLGRLAAEHGLPAFVSILEATKGAGAASLPGVWAASFDKTLVAAGWPGDGALDSTEYQVVTAWREKLLPLLAMLDQVAGPLPRTQALSLLRRLAAETDFQPEAPTGPLQVVGLLEASGLEFDHLWVMGVNEDVFPAASRPNPFIPLALQVRERMPHADAERELSFARSVLSRLKAASPQTIFSYAQRQGDCQLRPSPLIAELEPAQPDLAAPLDPVTCMRQDALHLEQVCDQDGPALAVGLARGGTGILRDQALCPFRAFAHHRLQARGFETPDPGIDAPTRGNLLHRALEIFWSEVQTHQQLVELAPAARTDIVEKSINYAITEIYRTKHDIEDQLLLIEKSRMARLIEDWLESVELPRQPFRVTDVEREQQIQVGPLKVRTVVDRVDQLEDGRRVVLDYKTGEVKADLLIGERLLEPQLPIYAITDESGQAEGVAFAQLRGGNCRLVGVAGADSLLPGVKSVERHKAAAALGLGDWSQLIEHWQQQLEELAEEFTSGRAQVDPVNSEQACRYCDLKTFCRVAEREGETS